MPKKAATKSKRVSVIEKRFNNQVDSLLDALSKLPDLNAPWSCLYAAAYDTADLDTAINRNRTPIKKLIKEAVAKAKYRAEFTTEWDWKASPDEIVVELNRVLEPLGITAQYPEPGCGGDSVAFEFIRCPNNTANAGV
jgi:hypothetical protein